MPPSPRNHSAASTAFMRRDGGLSAIDLTVLTTITLLASFTAIAVQWAVATITPIVGGILRFMMAAAIIGVILAARGKLPIPRRSDYLRIMILGIVCVPINQVAFWGGVAMANASHSAMLYSTTPVLVTVMACLVHIERWSGRVLAGAVLAALGVLVILMNSGLFLKSSFIRGDLLLLVAAATWSGYLVFSRDLNGRYGSLAVQFWIFVTGSLISMPLLIFESTRQNWSKITIQSWIGLAYLSVVVAVIVFFLFNWSMRRQPPSRVATFSNAAYPLTLIWEALLNRHVPGVWFLLGSALVLGGMILTLYRPAAVITISEELDPIAGVPSDEKK